MRVLRTSLSVTSSVVCWLSAAGITYAQDGSRLEEIVVTAQKRTESVMTVPIAVTAISGDDLAAVGIGNTADLKFVTPGFVYDELDGFPLYYIRGIGADFTQPGTNSSVAVYVDGIFQNLSQSSSQSLLDVERVEVIKGPQGTLFGRNTTGGAVSIVLRKPSTEGLVAKASAGISNYNGYSTSAYLSGPITESLAASIAGVYERRDSFFDNRAAGRHLDDRKSRGGRGKLLWHSDEGAEVQLGVWYFKTQDDANGAFNQLQSTSLGPVLGGQLSDSPDYVYNDFPVFWEVRQKGADLKVTVPFSGFNLVSLTGYQDWLDPSGVDFDATDAPIAFFFSDSTTKTFSQELQFVSTGEGPLEWVGGLYYLRNAGAFDPLNVPAGTTPPLTIDDPLTIIHSESIAKAYAVFAQASYKFGSDDRWRITAGGRYSVEKAKLLPTTIDITGIGRVATFPKDNEKWTEFSPKLTVDYSTENTLTYITVARGFKSGAYNLPAPGDLEPVEPEELTSIEMGFKASLADGRARLELAAYSYDYKDLQVQFITNQNAPTTLSNADKATSRGLELSIAARPIPSLDINAGVAWMQKREYDDYEGGVAYIDNGFGNTAVPGDFSGNKLSHAPKLSGNIGAIYRRSFPMGSLELAANVYYSDDYFFSAENSPRAKQDSYTTVTGRATWRTASDRWSLSIWGNNITDEEYFSQKLINALGILSQYAPRRTYGLTIGYSIE